MRKLNPDYITGLIDGDGTVGILFTPKPSGTGWQIKPYFEIAASNNPANIAMFAEINNFFGGIGRIVPGYSNTPNKLTFSITGLKNCVVVRNHLMIHPLFTFKLVYFQLWSAVIDIMLTGAHLTWSGLLLIIALKANFKNGLSPLLTQSFPDYVSVPQPSYSPDLSLINIHWLAGFMNADGSFEALVLPNKAYRLGKRATIQISIGQNDRSKIVLEAIQNYLGFGSVNKLAKDASRLQIGSIQDINMFINKFETAQLSGAKALDYADFCKIITIMNSKGHLTLEGLNAIQEISAGMNSNRKYFGEE